MRVTAEKFPAITSNLSRPIILNDPNLFFFKKKPFRLLSSTPLPSPPILAAPLHPHPWPHYPSSSPSPLPRHRLPCSRGANEGSGNGIWRQRSGWRTCWRRCRGSQRPCWPWRQAATTTAAIGKKWLRVFFKKKKKKIWDINIIERPRLEVTPGKFSYPTLYIYILVCYYPNIWNLNQIFMLFHTLYF